MKVRNILVVSCLAAIVAGWVFYGCKRKKESYIGPEYLSAPADFSVPNFNVTDNVDFTSENCIITADFSARVTYTVTITGLSSGAVKTYSAVGSSITTGSIGNIWDGTHDGLYFFRAGELVNVKLTFFRSEFTVDKTITLTAAKDYFVGNDNIRSIGPKSNVSYESNTIGSTFPVQFSFSEAVNNSDKIAERALASNYSIKAIQGNYILRIAGKSAQSDGFFVGGVQHREDLQTVADAFLIPEDWNDESKIYFNVYIYGVSNSNAIVNLEFHESDVTNPSNTGAKKECGGQALNGFGHDPCTDDGFVYPVTVSHTGWKLFSVKYSDFAKSGSAVNGGSGNGIKEPGRVARIQMGVVSTPAFETAVVMFDYPVLTYGAPFDPSK